MAPKRLAKKSSRPLFAGIDPGKTGFIAIYDGDRIRKFWPVPWLDREPDLFRIAKIVRAMKMVGVVYALIEHQQAMVYEGAVGAFTLGGGYCALRMALHMAGVRFEVVKSSDWKRSLDIPAPAATAIRFRNKPTKPKTKDKKKLADYREELDTWKTEKLVIERQRRANKTEARRKRKWLAISKAQQLFPDVDFRLTPSHKTDHDGKVESALISVVAYRRHMGGK